MGSRRAPQTVSKPLRLTKMPIGWGVGQSGSGWVFPTVQDGMSGQPLRGGPEMGSRATGQCLSQPFCFSQLPGD